MGEEQDSWLAGIGVDVGSVLAGVAKTFEDSAPSVAETVANSGASVIEVTGQAWNQTAEAPGQTWQAVSSVLGDVKNAAPEAVADVMESSSAVVDAATKVVDDVKEAVSEAFDEVVAGVEKAFDGPKQNAEADATQGNWLPPWVQEYNFPPGASPAYLNYEGGKKNIDTNWVRDVVATGLLAVDAGLLATIALRQLPVSEMVRWYVSGIAGGSAAFWRSYKGYQIQGRVTAELAPVHEWYGRYRINVVTSAIEAVDFQGRGPTYQTYTIARLEQRLTDAQGTVLYTHPPCDLPVGFNVDSSKPLPEWSFGY